MDDRLPSIAENDQKEEDYQSMDVGIPLLDAKRKMMAPSVYSEAMSRKELEIVCTRIRLHLNLSHMNSFAQTKPKKSGISKARISVSHGPCL